MSRKEEVIIHQLRTGKSPLAANCLYRYKKLPEEKGRCLQGCDAKETVEHLLSCPVYGRQRLETCGATNILELLNNKPDKIILFLEKIGRLAAPDL